MKPLPDAVFRTSAAGMELSWVYAWTAFILHAAVKQPYPLPEAAAIFVLAAVLTAFTRGRGWRIIQILALHGAGLTAFVFRSVYVLWYPSEAFWSLAWPGDFFSRAREPVAWFLLAVFCAGAAVFWISGVRYSRRSTSYREVCARFDKALGWLFALMFVKLFMGTQMGIQSTEAISDSMIFPFFIFALLTVALARNRSAGRKGFMTGYRGIGLIISFSTAVFLCGTGLVLLTMPYLRAASDAGYEVIKTSGKFLGPILIKILMFLFGYKPGQPARSEIIPPKPPVEVVPESAPTWWTEFFLTIYLWVFWVLLGLVGLFIIGIGGWYLWRWLFSKTRKAEHASMETNRFRQWLESWIAYLQVLYEKLFGRKKGNETIRLYRSLLKWGRRSGLPYRNSETPLEYGRRLKQRFDGVSAEIDLIISAFNLHVYGEVVCDGRETVCARRALKRLQRPTLWPKRFRLWFLHSG